MDEALLTGESLPVVKDPYAKFDDESVGVGDRINMAYSSSTVTKGRCRGIVVATGMSTEIGAIALSLKGKPKKQSRSMSRKKGALQPIKGGLLRTYDSIGKILGLTVGTPLQVKLSKLAYLLLFFAILLAIIVFGVNKFNVTHEVAIYAISLGIAIIPESLIAVLTITMAIGMRRMVKRMVIVRKLDALEALGGVTNICSDKTGTLTQGRMITRKVWVPGVGLYSVEKPSEPVDPTSGSVMVSRPFTSNTNIQTIERAVRFTEDNRDTSSTTPDTPRVEEVPDIEPEPVTSNNLHPSMETFLHASSLCNLATVFYDKTKAKWVARGDPTETPYRSLPSVLTGLDAPVLLKQDGSSWASSPLTRT
jgi:potassium/sodium efflux P-type ATPase